MNDTSVQQDAEIQDCIVLFAVTWCVHLLVLWGLSLLPLCPHFAKLLYFTHCSFFPLLRLSCTTPLLVRHHSVWYSIPPLPFVFIYLSICFILPAFIPVICLDSSWLLWDVFNVAKKVSPYHVNLLAAYLTFSWVTPFLSYLSKNHNPKS
jgi:hypothetical protein